MTMLRCFILFLGLSANVIHAAEPISIQIAADNSYPPYSYAQQGGLTGVYTDIITEITNKMPGYDVSLLALPWKRALMKVKDGDLQFIYPPYLRPKKRPHLIYSEPLLTEWVVMFCHKDVMRDVKRTRFPEDFRGLSVGRNLGFLIGDNIIEAGEHGTIDLVTVPEANTALRKMLSKRLDCYVNDRLSILFELKKLRSELFIEEHQLIETIRFSKENAYLAAHGDIQRYPHIKPFLKSFNQHLLKMKSDGRLQNIIQKYVP